MGAGCGGSDCGFEKIVNPIILVQAEQAEEGALDCSCERPTDASCFGAGPRVPRAILRLLSSQACTWSFFCQMSSGRPGSDTSGWFGVAGGGGGNRGATNFRRGTVVLVAGMKMPASLRQRFNWRPGKQGAP